MRSEAYTAIENYLTFTSSMQGSRLILGGTTSLLCLAWMITKKLRMSFKESNSGRPPLSIFPRRSHFLSILLQMRSDIISSLSTNVTGISSSELT
ncbi:hypothetical protein SLE2022_279290 [Rubroshorea leprosula]